MTSVTLHAPLAGWMSDLSEVPDAVFADNMMGEGVAIDPTAGTLIAPCDATVLLVPDSAHSVTLKAVNGAEILLHIGLETVRLEGRGFTAHVKTGQKVRLGDPLVSFNMDLVLAGAASLVTPIVIANGDAFDFAPAATGCAVAAGEPIGEVRPSVASGHAPKGGEERHSAELVLPLPNGIHARPAARIAALAKQQAAEIILNAHGRQADARSPVALMTLGARHGDKVEIVAQGDNAEAAVAAVRRLIEAEIEDAPQKRPAKPAAPAAPPAEGNVLSGVCAVPGVALGIAVQLRVQDRDVVEQGVGEASERSALGIALAEVRQRLEQAADRDGEAQGSIVAAHLALLDDVELKAAADARIAEGKSAGFSWRSASRLYADRLRATGDPLIEERVADLIDLERQVLSALAADVGDAIPTLPEGAILLADEILPSQLMEFDLTQLAGICTAGGGPTSHAAILAAGANVPMLVAAGERVAHIADGAALLIEADACRLTVDPSRDVREAAEIRIAAASKKRQADRANAREDCYTKDGTRIEIFANLASIADAEQAVAAGAEGCGLLRTEFLFLDRETPPDEEEQRAAYQAVADALGDLPLIVRTLDVGGDKPVPYLDWPHEENPALGLRGIRTSLWRTDLLDTQLRAILSVKPAGRCRIMLPMIVDLGELCAVRERAEGIARELGIDAPVTIGVNVETPAATILADQLSEAADFFSVGSNDLTQYTLAMDRTNSLVAARVDGLHPAVLRLIDLTARAAEKNGKIMAVCGGLASDPASAVLLVGLGVRELSATPAMIASVKAQIRAVTLDECRSLAARALEARSAEDVKALLKETER